MKARVGWTLIETLVVFAVVAVLLAITIPVLRSALARSQTTKNMSNMRATMQDFFVWSAQHQGRMLNAGLPQDEGTEWFYGGDDLTEYEYRIYVYTSQSETWPTVLKHAFGSSSPHWQSTYQNALEYLGDGATQAELSSVSDDWLWSLPSQFEYSRTFLTRSDAWKFPGLGLASQSEYAEFFLVVQVADIAFPSDKGVLLHDIPEDVESKRLIAFGDGSVGVMNMNEAVPAGVHPMDSMLDRRGTPVRSTENGFAGRDWTHK
jgi:type II secretory pathway pseudopilin PulG